MVKLTQKSFKGGKLLVTACIAAAGLVGLASCADKNDEFDDHGSSSVTALTAPTLAYMGEVSYSITQ